MNLKRRQSGVVLLTVMLVIIAASSYVLLQALNVAASNTTYDESTTRRALMEAKMALIGYAVGFPERSTNPNAGPGRLPCPDYDFFGTVADPVIGSADSCSLGAGTETGLFPWYTIDTNELVDGSGSRLWYAVSDVHRSNVTTPINSDTIDATTPMQVDLSAEDIVAVIIAPGAAVGSQVRGTSTADIYNPTKYLEGENATLGDNVFTAIGGANFNDTVMVITRAELMAAVEQRVLQEVASALGRYHGDPDDNPATTSDEGYPWLRTFGDPDMIAAPVVGSESLTLASEGQLPVHQSGVSYDANFSFTWNVPTSEGSLSQTDNPVDAPGVFPWFSCAHLSGCVDPTYSLFHPSPVSGAPDSTWQQGTCTWTALNALTCIAKELFSSGADDYERTYTVTLTGIDPDLASPTSIADRVRQFNVSGTLPSGASITIQLDDVFDPSGVASSRGTTTLTLGPGDNVTAFNFDQVPLYLTPFDHTDPAAVKPPGALPQWFTANGWHRQLIVGYANAERPGDAATSCVAGTDCLTVQWDRPGTTPDVVMNDVSAVVSIAGVALGTTRPSTNIADYFEDENATSDGTFAKGSTSRVFNDRLQLIDPNAP